MTKVVGVQIFENKGKPGTPLEQVNALEGHGLEGDRHCMKDRPISMTDKVLTDWVAAQRYDGLCFKRYKTNIVFDDMSSLSMAQGDTLNFDGGATLRMEGVFKQCYGEECELFREGVDCIMPGRMVFASCAKGGCICVDDQVSNA